MIRFMYKTENNMKRKIAIFFLALANMIILAHAVIAHHHDDEICISLATTHHEHDSNSHGQDEANLPNCDVPYCHGDIDDCALSTVYVNLGHDKQTFQSYDFDFSLLPCAFTLFPDYFIYPITDDVGLPFRQTPYLLSYHNEYISQSHGLRAPPAC